MKEEFITFVKELFPSINPFTAEKVKKAIAQFRLSGKTFQYFLSKPFNFLAQGDIVEELPFIIYDSLGNQRILKTKGMLLSNTCDAENDDNIFFASLLPVKDISNLDREMLINNLYYRLLYFPHPSEFSEYVVDFSIISSYSRKFITISIEKGFLKKSASLNDYGYYLFLCKLTVHLMRPEDKGVQKDRLLTLSPSPQDFF